MANNDATLWTEAGKALAYLVTGAGTLWGTLWSARKIGGETHSRGGSRLEEEIERLKGTIDTVRDQCLQNRDFISAQTKSVEKFERAVERVHERLDELFNRVSSIEGYMKGRG